MVFSGLIKRLNINRTRKLACNLSFAPEWRKFRHLAFYRSPLGRRVNKWPGVGGGRVMHSLNMYELATPRSTETEPLSVGDSGYALCLAGHHLPCLHWTFLFSLPPLNQDTSQGRAWQRRRNMLRTRMRKRMRGRELISQEPPQWKLKTLPHPSYTPPPPPPPPPPPKTHLQRSTSHAPLNSREESAVILGDKVTS